MMYDIIVFLNSVFVRPNVNEKPLCSKIFALGTVFKNLRFGGPKTPFTCGQKALKRRKKSPFSKISGYLWTGLESLFVCLFFFQMCLLSSG